MPQIITPSVNTPITSREEDEEQSARGIRENFDNEMSSEVEVRKKREKKRTAKFNEEDSEQAAAPH
jgi:hypothetical protein